MTDAANGYMTEIEYTYDYHAELNPHYMRLGLLNAGFRAPEIGAACELGCGQGVSLVIHAAATLTRWCATDVNPDHVAFARTMARSSGIDVQIDNDAIADMVDRTDLPDFDYIAVNGVWSWVTDHNRQAIVEFARRRLKPGGVLYVSYNALPGSGAIEPLRHLLAEHASTASRNQPIVDRIQAALSFAEQLSATRPGYLQDHPKVAGELGKLRELDQRYLAHEYFSGNWQPMHFSAVAERLAAAELQFACSAFYSEAVDALHMDPTQRSLLAAIDDPVFRQTARDFLVNQRFRRDFWVKGGGNRLSGKERTAALRDERVVLVAHQPELPLKIRAILALDEAGTEATKAAVLAVLGDRRPKRLGDIAKILPDIPFDRLVDAVMLLVGYARVSAAQDDTVVATVEGRTRKLNARLLEWSKTDAEIQCLTSPITGGGVRVSRPHRLFLAAGSRGTDDPKEWARSALPFVTSQHRVDIADLAAEAQTFSEGELLSLKALRVA